MSQYRRDSRGRQNARPSWLKAQLRRRPKPLWLLATAHILALGIALVLYALPHHVIPRAGVSVGLTSSRSGGVVQAETPVPETEATPVVESTVEAQPEAEATPAPTAEPTPEPTPVEPVGSFRTKFAEHFTAGSVERTDTAYRSANLDITISYQYDETLQTHYYVVDAYIADISCLATAFAQDKYGNGYSEWPQDAAQRYQAIITMNGDYYGSRQGGIVIRNGTLYRDEKNMMDLCVLYWDGTMRTFDPFNFNAQDEINNGAYQCWCFGPALLDADGHALTSFNSTVNKANPRSVIGYFEPGHYCLVAVDGRTSADKGMSTADLAILMESLGCRAAYNLDGGQSSILVAGSTVINKPIKNGRKSSDFIMLLDQAGS